MGAGVPAQIAVQRLLLGTEGVEEVQDRLPFDPFVVPLQQELQPNGDLPGRLAQGAGHETLTEESGGRDARLDQRQPNADGSPRIGPSGSSSRWAGSPTLRPSSPGGDGPPTIRRTNQLPIRT
jgi:hypothetical protein